MTLKFTPLEQRMTEVAGELDSAKIDLGEFLMHNTGQMSKECWERQRQLHDICIRLEGKKTGLFEAWEIIQKEQNLGAVV